MKIYFKFCHEKINKTYLEGFLKTIMSFIDVMGLAIWGLLQSIMQGEPKLNCHDNQLSDMKINWKENETLMI
jgi:hypothetical protein